MSDIDDSGLPFAIRYGPWIWKALIVIAVVLVIGGSAAVRRWRARRAVRRSLDTLRGCAAASPAVGTVVLEGKLRAPTPVDGVAAGSLWLVRPGRARAERVDLGDDLWIEVAGERVSVRGPVRVLAGTCARAVRRSVRGRGPAALVDRAREAALIGPDGRIADGFSGGTLTWILDGEQVVVEGMVGRDAAGDGAAGYREDAGRWVLRGVDGPLELHAARGATAVVPRSLPSVALSALVTAVATFVVLAISGLEIAAKLDGHEFPEDGRPIELSNFDGFSLAAAAPGSRGKAIQRLSDALQRHRYRDEATMRRLLAIEWLDAGCPGMSSLVEELPRLEDRLAWARRCGDVHGELELLVLLGRYDEAAVILETYEGRWPAREVHVAIATGRWPLAVRAIDELVERIRDRGPDDDDRALLTEAECLGYVFRDWSGDTVAEAKLRERARQRGGGACATALAAVMPRTSWLDEFARYATDDDGNPRVASRQLALALAWAHGRASDRFGVWGAERAIRDLSANSVEPTWVLDEQSTPPADHAPDRAAAAAWHAHQDVIRGDLSGAAARLRSVEPAVDPGTTVGRDLQMIREALIVRSGRSGDDPTGRVARAGVMARFDGELGDVINVGFGCRRDVGPQAAQAAREGDGLPLARVLQSCFTHVSSGWLAAVVQGVETGREELVAAIRWHLPRLDYDMVGFPFGWVEELAGRRDLLRILGDDEGVAYWQAIIDRHLAVIDDPDKRIAFLLWNAL